jgi:hypothetical protein
MRFLRRGRQPIPELHVDPNTVAPEPLDRSDPIQTVPNGTDIGYAEAVRFPPFKG